MYNLPPLFIISLNKSKGHFFRFFNDIYALKMEEKIFNRLRTTYVIDDEPKYRVNRLFLRRHRVFAKTI